MEACFRDEDDNATIGVILCSQKNEAIASWDVVGEISVIRPLFAVYQGEGNHGHSRGRRFDPASLHQKGPEIARFQDLF